MKKRKKLFHSMLSLFLIITLVAGNMMITKAATLPEGINKAEKTATLGQDGKTATVQFEIEVDEIKTSEFTGKNTDVVLVIDTSGSMGDNSKLGNMKLAANKFIASFLEAEEGKTNPYAQYVRIGIVSYESTATKVKDFTKDASALKTAVNGLVADGGTNIQDGIRKGQAMLNASNADNKIMVLLSDGEPTYSFKGTAYDTAKNLIVAFDYNTRKGSGGSYTYNSYDINEEKEVTEAVTYKKNYWGILGWYNSDDERITRNYIDSDITVLTEATGTYKQGSDSIPVTYKEVGNKLGWYDSNNTRLAKEYDSYRVSNKTDAYGVYTYKTTNKIVSISNNGLPTISEAALAKNAGTVIYTINYDASSNTNATYVMNNVASVGKNYSASASATAIEQVFRTVGREIEKVIAAGEGAMVTDIIPTVFGAPTNFNVNGVNLTDATLSDKITVDDQNNTFVWKLGKLEKGTYTLSYDISLDVTANELVNEYGVKNGVVTVPTNKSAVLSFYDKNNTEQKVIFGIPTVEIEVYPYTVTYVFEQMRNSSDTPSVAAVNGYAYKGENADVSIPESPIAYQAPTATLNGEDVSVTAGSTYTINSTTTDGQNLVVNYPLKVFTVDFVDWNDSELKTEQVKYGFDATAPTNPSREGYTFQQWDRGYNNITADTTVKALYNINKYNVTYELYVDGKLAYTAPVQQVEYGGDATVPTVPDNVIPKDTPALKYSYSDWNHDGKNITQDTVIKASYTSTPQSYSVTFILNDEEDGIQTLDVQTVEYGKGATAPEVQKKADTKQYTYTLSEWDKNFSNITGNTVVTRTQTRTLNKYKVTFEIIDADNNSTKTEQTVAYGSKADVPEIIVPADNAQYTYSATQWPAEAYNEVTDDADYQVVITKTVRQYDYKFIVVEGAPNSGSEVLASGTVDYGTVVYAPKVTTGSAIGYECTLEDAWEEGAAYTITGPTEIVAYRVYDKNIYNVSFYLDTIRDGVLVSSTQLGDIQSVEHGNAATAPDVAKPADNQQFSYSLTDWDKTFNNVTSNLEVHRTLIETTKSYTVTFEITDEFGVTTTTKDTVKYGTAATAPALPTRVDNDEWKYTINSWDKDFSNVVEDITVKASVTREKKQYTITYQVVDGEKTTILFTDTVDYGTKVTTPVIPLKAGNEEFNYVIVNGWDANQKYEVTKNEIFTAGYEALKKEYTINFVVIDPDHEGGQYLLYSKTVPYGDEVDAPAIINDKVNDAQWSYTLKGFDSESYVVKSDMTVYATFTKTKNKYSVTFMSEDGTEQIAKSSAIDYGTILNEVASIPDKAKDAEFIYTADAWRTNTFGEGDVVSFTTNGENSYVVTGNTVVYASYTKEKRSYVVTFKNVDGTPFTGETSEITTNVLYGDTVPTDVSIAAKALADAEAASMKTAEKSYVFTGWNMLEDQVLVDASTAVTSAIKADLTVYASYKESTNKYTVTFVNYNGDFLGADTVDYGMPAKAPSNPTRQSVTSGYITTSYTFIGWDKDFSKVTENMTVTALFTSRTTDWTPVVEPSVTPTPTATPTPEPSATPVPTLPEPSVTPPVEEIEIEDGEIPEGTPTTDEEEEIAEEKLPEGTPTLPKTGTANEILIYMIGITFILLGGIVVKVEKNKKHEG